MRYLRANTATIVTVGPFYDKTDGVTIETGLTITNERISLVVDANDGSAPTLVLDNVTGATSGTSNDLNYITNCDAGLMQLELAAADTNYAGRRAMLTVTDAANHVPVFHEFTILPANVYDSLLAGTDLLDVNVSQISEDTTAADNAELMFDGTGYAGGTTKLSVNTAEVADAVWDEARSGHTTSGTFGEVSTSADVADAVWDELLSGHSTTGSAGKNLTDNATEVAKVPKSDSTVTWNATALASVKSQAVAALATDTYAEPSAIPAATSTLSAKVAWMFTLMRNKLTQTSSTTTLRNDNDNASIGTRTVSDDGTTFTRGEWT